MTRPCPACASTATTGRVMAVPEHMYGIEAEFDYLTCAECASVYIAEIPDDLARYYDTSAYYSFDDNPTETMSRTGVRQVIGLIGRATLYGPGRAVVAGSQLVPMRQVRTLVSMFNAVRIAGLPRGSRSSVLDVGSGSGYLVLALELAGMTDVVGIDPFATADVRVGRRSRILRRELGELDDTYDLIMMHHSFEHVPDPRATLDAARKRLSDGGRVLIRMPTVSSAAYERYAADWIGCDAPRHLTLFSRDGMRRLAAAAGFTIAAVVDDSNESQFWAGEQFRTGVPLVDPRSEFVDPKASAFTRRQIRGWQRQAAQLNRESRGDQAAWVLTPA